MSQPHRIRNSESPTNGLAAGGGGGAAPGLSDGEGPAEKKENPALPEALPSIHAELAQAHDTRQSCALATLVFASGSVPRAPGAKMIVYADGRLSGTVGGGKFESLVIAEAMETIREGTPRLRQYPLHEGVPDSFGAICGGEVGVFIEPVCTGETVWIIGGGHCSQAIAQLAKACGFHVGVLEDRAELLEGRGFVSVDQRVSDMPAPEFIASREWTVRDALIIVNRNPLLDKLALAAALRRGVPGYVGMMGSQRKVRRVFAELEAEGHSRETLARVYAPIGLAIGAESPAEIAVSIIAEVLQVCRRGVGGHMRG